MYQFQSIGQLLFGSTPTFDTHDLKGASAGVARVGFIMQSPWHNEAITHVAYRQGTTSGTPASNSHRVTIQTVDGSGNPTGTDVGSTTTTFTPSSANDGKTVWIALANSYSPARGTFFAVVIENDANTSTNGITISLRCAENIDFSMVLPYASSYASSAWTKTSSGFRTPLFGVRTSSKRYGLMFESVADRTVTSSGHRSCMGFTVPTSVCSTYKVAGLIARNRLNSGTGILGIWDTSGTLLTAGTSLDLDITRAAAGTSVRQSFFDDSTLPTLNAGTKYYIGWEHNGSTVGWGVATLTSADDRLMLSEFGTDVCYASWNGSAWTETTTDFPRGKILLTDLTFSGGSGGAILMGGLSQTGIGSF